jgi:hypothetical protein
VVGCYQLPEASCIDESARATSAAGQALTWGVLSCIAEQRHRTDKARADGFTAFGGIKPAKKTGKGPHLHIYDITRKSTGAPNELASNGATMRWPTSKRRDDGIRAKHTAIGWKVAQSSGIKTTGMQIHDGTSIRTRRPGATPPQLLQLERKQKWSRRRPHNNMRSRWRHKHGGLETP